MKNIFAYTEFDYKTYPAYVSLNKRDKKYVLTVRSKESQTVQEIEIPFMELLKLQSSILGELSFGNDLNIGD